MPPRWQKGIVRAKTLRRATTLSEAMLWRDLRGRRAEAKFRRQVPIGPFVVDFACPEARLVVEVDGPSHETPDGRAQDAGRDAWLEREGWRVLRVSNDEVRTGLALGKVEAALRSEVSFSRCAGEGVALSGESRSHRATFHSSSALHLRQGQMGQRMTTMMRGSMVTMSVALGAALAMAGPGYAAGTNGGHMGGMGGGHMGGMGGGHMGGTGGMGGGHMGGGGPAGMGGGGMAQGGGRGIGGGRGTGGGQVAGNRGGGGRWAGGYGRGGYGFGRGAALGLGLGAFGGYGLGGFGDYDGYGDAYGYGDGGFGGYDEGPGVQYSYGEDDGLQTGRSAATLGDTCTTPVLACQLKNTSYVGGSCSCRVSGGRSRGHVTP